MNAAVERACFSKTMQGVQNCLDAKVMTGVCTSVAKSNFDDLVTEKWLDNLIEMGVLYTWFHVYRPMGPDACPDLCLTPEQQRSLRQLRRRDATQEADRDHRCLLRRRR